MVNGLTTFRGSTYHPQRPPKRGKSISKSVEEFLDCGLLHGGFCRIRYPSCQREQLLAFSCQTRNFCPSCPKRGALFAEKLSEKILLDARCGFVSSKQGLRPLLNPHNLSSQSLHGGCRRRAGERSAFMVRVGSNWQSLLGKVQSCCCPSAVAEALDVSIALLGVRIDRINLTPPSQPLWCQGLAFRIPYPP